VTPLQDALHTACEMLSLSADLNYPVTIGDVTLISVVRIRDLGARNGMLVFSSYEQINNFVRQLGEQGYGYSVLSAPRMGGRLDIGSYIEMFRDWGWAGDPMKAPQWYSNGRKSEPDSLSAD
jgi:hypothetical protein